MGVQKISSVRSARKLHVVAYVRVSTFLDCQDESYEQQTLYYEGFIRSHSDWEFAGVYGDRVSGTHSENRLEFQRMIQDALAMKIDLIYCKSVSRWARNAVEALESVKYLTGNKINIVFEQEGIDTRDPSVLFQLSLASSIAQSESESISENMKWLYRNRAERGIYKPQRNKHFGYNTDDHTFVPDRNAEYVRLMFKRFAVGATTGEIEEELKDLGVTDKGKPITQTRIRSILNNEVYVGDKEFGKKPQRNVITGKPDEVQVKKYFTNHHEAIIDRETWDAVQARLGKEKLVRKRENEKRHRMLNILRVDPEVPPRRLCKMAGVERTVAANFISNLRKKRKLIRDADGCWMLDEKMV